MVHGIEAQASALRLVWEISRAVFTLHRGSSSSDISWPGSHDDDAGGHLAWRKDKDKKETKKGESKKRRGNCDLTMINQTERNLESVLRNGLQQIRFYIFLPNFDQQNHYLEQLNQNIRRKNTTLKFCSGMGNILPNSGIWFSAHRIDGYSRVQKST